MTLTRAQKFLQEEEKNKKQSRAAKFLEDEKTNYLQDKLDTVKKSNQKRPGFLEEAAQQLKPFALAPLSALTGTIDSFLQGGMHGDDFFSMPSQSNKASDVVDVIREKNPSFKFTNKPQEVAYDVVTSLMGLKPRGKILELLSKGASKTPGLKTAGNYLSKKLEGVSKYNPANTIITAGTAAAPHLVDEDNPSGRFAASLGTGLGLQTLFNLGSVLNKKVPKTAFDKAGVGLTRADVTQGPLLKFFEKKADIFPFMGRTAAIKNDQRNFVRNMLGVENSTFLPDEHGRNFYKAAEEALPNIENKTALRVKLLDNFEKLIGDVDLNKTNKTYGRLYSESLGHPSTKQAFKNDRAVRYIDELTTPYVKNPVTDPFKNTTSVPLKTLNLGEKLMDNVLSTSPVGQEFQRALLIDKNNAALKKLNKSDHKLYMKTKEEAVDYYKNVDAEVKKIKGINPEEQNLLANTLFTKEPVETYKTVKVIRDNLSPESIPEFNKLVTQALGTGQDNLQFSFGNFANKVSKMPKDMKQAYFGQNLSKVDEAVSLIKKTGNLDISKPGISEWKIMKLLTFAGAVPIKSFDFYNTWKPLVNYARKQKVAAQYYAKNPKEAQKRPNFIKTLSSVLFRPQDDEE